MATNTFFDLEALAKKLEEKLNGTDFENIISYGLNKIYPHIEYAFRLISDTDTYEAGYRKGNNVVRYINGEMNVINNQSEGIGNTTYNAVVETRVDFLIPLMGPERKNKALIKALRALVNNTLQYTQRSDVQYAGMTYTHITEYTILNSGVREQRDVIGDSVSLTIFVTHSLVALGVASSSIEVSVFNPFTNLYEVVAYDNEGAARKTVTEQNTYAKSVPESSGRTSVNESCAMPTSTLFTLSFDMYSRLFIMDYYIDRYVYKQIVDVIKVQVKRPNPEHQFNGSAPSSVTTEYDMIIESAGHNAKLGALATSSVTLVSVAPLAEPEA